MFKRTPQIGGFLDAVETVVNYLQSVVWCARMASVNGEEELSYHCWTNGKHYRRFYLERENCKARYQLPVSAGFVHGPRPVNTGVQNDVRVPDRVHGI